MLTIENIDKAIGMTCYGRYINRISLHRNTIGEESYVFVFDRVGDGKRFNKSQEIHLVRNEYSETYRLFSMGLQVATERRVSLSEVKCLTTLLVEISEVLRITRNWWGNKQTK